MNVVVIGTIGIDDIETPRAKVMAVLGGSATYACMASRLFAPTNLTSVVGQDFPPDYQRLLESLAIDLRGLEILPGKTFRWGGRYHENMNQRDTTFTDLNVLQEFDPKVPEHATQGAYVFVGNTDPVIQLRILDQVIDPRFVVVDSMNFWIQSNLATLTEVFKRATVVVLNEEEIRLFTGLYSLPLAVARILALGPLGVVIKRGEYGAALATRDGWFFAPGYPIHDVVDPTGAGDSFAGAFLGSLAETGDDSPQALRRAVVYGSVAASFTVEAFGVDRLYGVTRREIDARFEEFRQLVFFG